MADFFETETDKQKREWRKSLKAEFEPFSISGAKVSIVHRKPENSGVVLEDSGEIRFFVPVKVVQEKLGWDDNTYIHINIDLNRECLNLYSSFGVRKGFRKLLKEKKTTYRCVKSSIAGLEKFSRTKVEVSVVSFNELRIDLPSKFVEHLRGHIKSSMPRVKTKHKGSFETKERVMVKNHDTSKKKPHEMRFSVHNEPQQKPCLSVSSGVLDGTNFAKLCDSSDGRKHGCRYKVIYAETKKGHHRFTFKSMTESEYNELSRGKATVNMNDDGSLTMAVPNMNGVFEPLKIMSRVQYKIINKNSFEIIVSGEHLKKSSFDDDEDDDYEGKNINDEDEEDLDEDEEDETNPFMDLDSVPDLKKYIVVNATDGAVAFFDEFNRAKDACDSLEKDEYDCAIYHKLDIS